MMRIKRLIVAGLERSCGLLDEVPGPTFLFTRGERVQWSRHAGYGCYVFGLASLSAELDQRWHTNVWKPEGEN